jgi:phosphinothricin acetyltransferase
MTAAIAIGPASPADAAPIAEIYAHHVVHGVATFELEPPDTSEIARRIAAVLDAGHPWLIARDADGQVLGYAYTGAYHPRAAYRSTCEDSVYIRHDQIGKGIGTALLAALIERATAAGFRQMIALITGGVEPSIALHSRAGFAIAGQLTSVGYKHGRWLDVVLMQRALVPA